MLANCQDCCTGNIHWKNPASIRRRMKFWEKSTKCSVLACWSRFLIDWFLFGTTKNIHVSVLVKDANAIKLRGYVTLLDPDFRLQSREAFLQKSLLVLISARLRPNWNQPRNVRMFAGLHRNWRTTEGSERLSVETRVPHAAVPSLPGDFEASLDAKSAVGDLYWGLGAARPADRRREDFLLLLLRTVARYSSRPVHRGLSLTEDLDPKT